RGTFERRASTAAICRVASHRRKAARQTTAIRNNEASQDIPTVYAIGTAGAAPRRAPRRSGAMIPKSQRVLSAGAPGALGPLDGGGDETVMRRQVADGIRVRRIAREQIRLAATAAEVAGPLRA